MSVRGTFKTPLMGKILELTKYVSSVRTVPPKWLQHAAVSNIINKCFILSRLELEHLRGKNVYGKILDAITDIKVTSYFIYGLHGWTGKIVNQINTLCVEIEKQVSKINMSTQNSQNL
jgi:hypothetical protein